MQGMISRTKAYCYHDPEDWSEQEQIRRRKDHPGARPEELSLRSEGVLSRVGPFADESNINGIGIFNANAREVGSIMDEDPGEKR
jgi:hypothetical protein